MRVYFIILALITQGTINAQSDFFQIEFEAFSPGEKTVMQMLENNPAEPFQGKATNGDFIDFQVLKGKPMLLWFWDVKDEFSIGQIDGLNLMHQIFSSDIEFIGLAYDKKVYIDELTERKAIDFPILPQSFKLGELHYGSELGQGRLFLIDSNGIVVSALPRSFFTNRENAYGDLRKLLKELN